MQFVEVGEVRATQEKSRKSRGLQSNLNGNEGSVRKGAESRFFLKMGQGGVADGQMHQMHPGCSEPQPGCCVRGVA